jgi:hypothetical protein
MVTPDIPLLTPRLRLVPLGFTPGQMVAQIELAKDKDTHGR